MRIVDTDVVFMILAAFWEAFGGQCYKLSDKKALYVSLMKFGVVFNSILGPSPPTSIHGYPRVSASIAEALGEGFCV